MKEIFREAWPPMSVPDLTPDDDDDDHHEKEGKNFLIHLIFICYKLN